MAIPKKRVPTKVAMWKKTRRLGTREVAMIMNMSPDLVARLAREGVIIGKKVGPREWGFTRKAIETFRDKWLAAA